MPTALTDEIFYPGELEVRSDERYLRDGITLPSDTIDELNAAAKALGIAELE